MWACCCVLQVYVRVNVLYSLVLEGAVPWLLLMAVSCCTLTLTPSYRAEVIYNDGVCLCVCVKTVFCNYSVCWHVCLGLFSCFLNLEPILDAQVLVNEKQYSRCREDDTCKSKEV